MPYPAYKDQRVVLKRNYIDDLAKQQQGNKMSGMDWYNFKAARATNQAIGRIIRHIKDFGMIVFCDERFAWPYNKKLISSWVEKRTKVY